VAIRQHLPEDRPPNRTEATADAFRRGSRTKPRLASGGLTTSSRMPWAAASAAGSSPAEPWSTNATSTVSPVAACTAAAGTPTWSRSCAPAAVTCRDSGWPRVSTAAWVLPPLRRLWPS
jgi:hypothetical protein